MGLLKIVRFFRGYISFRLEGGSPERFMNLCASEKIALWHGEKREDGFCAKAPLSCGGKIEKLAVSCGGNIHLEKSTGIPVLLRRYRKRFGLTVGFFALAAIIMVLSLFIWQIEIIGNEILSDEEILAELSSLGVKKGTLRSGVDARDVERQMQIAFNDLAWIAVNLNGSVARIIVYERVAAPPAVADGIPYNIVADSSGIITNIEVYEGRAAVKIGDAVQEGDLLISGIIDSKGDQSRYVHARGSITALTRESLSVTAPFKSEELIAGETKSFSWLEIADTKIPLFFSSSPEGIYEYEESYEDIPLLSILFPIKKIIRSVTFYGKQTVSLDPSQAHKKAAELLAQREQLVFDGYVIVQRDVVGQETEEGFMISADYICERQIGTEREIFINN